MQAICDSLGPSRSTRRLASGWRLPARSPTTTRPPYRNELSIQQAEFSLTQMLDVPVSGRIFQRAVRDNLDIGRPDHVGLIFNAESCSGAVADTGRFRHWGDHRRRRPIAARRYKHTKIKQYHKQGRARRTRPPSTTRTTPANSNG